MAAKADNTNSGFCPETKTFYSLRPTITLPSNTTITSHIFSLTKASSPPPHSPAIISSNTQQHITYKQLTTLVKTLSFSLKTKLNLSPQNDIAFVLSPNSLHLVILYLSLFSLNVVVSPSNPLNTKSEILHQLDLVKPTIAFTTSQHAHKIPSLKHKTILLDSAEFNSMMTTSQQEEQQLMTELSVKIDSVNDTAVILYSSGTTGRVKAVELTHQNFNFQAEAAKALRSNGSPTVSFCVVPLFHVYGLGYVLRGLAMGDSMVVMDKRFSLRGMMRDVEAFGVKNVAVAPPVVVAMMAVEERERELGKLEAVGCGGGPLAKEAVERFCKRFLQVQLLQAYGLTESSGRIFSTMGLEESRVLGATGRLMPNCQAKIVDVHTGIGLPPNTTGELWLKGPLIMKGYLGDKEATSAVLDSEGWFRTGDLCYINGQGFLFYVDRIKDLIKYKGYQIGPGELEELLQSHPDVVEAVVVPYPDKEAGQIPVAFVVKRLDSVTDELQIIDFVANKVAPYKKVRGLVFVDTIPKNATGKVLKKELLAKYTLSNSISKL